MLRLLRAFLRRFGFIIVQLQPAKRTARPVATIPFAIAAKGEQPPGLEPPPLAKE